MKFSGKTIKKFAKVKGARLTNTQTAAQALNRINKKYKAEGGCKDGCQYYHRGKGDWAKYSPRRDAKRRPVKGVRTGKGAQKKYGTPKTKTVRNGRGKVVGKVKGSNSHKADTHRTKTTFKGKGGRKYKGSI